MRLAFANGENEPEKFDETADARIYLPLSFKFSKVFSCVFSFFEQIDGQNEQKTILSILRFEKSIVEFGPAQYAICQKCINLILRHPEAVILWRFVP